MARGFSNSQSDRDLLARGLFATRWLVFTGDMTSIDVTDIIHLPLSLSDTKKRGTIGSAPTVEDKSTKEPTDQACVLPCKDKKENSQTRDPSADLKATTEQTTGAKEDVPVCSPTCTDSLPEPRTGCDPKGGKKKQLRC